MSVGLGRAALASLFLAGCTGLNPSYADATGGEGDSGLGTTTRDATGPDPSSPTGPSQTTTSPTQTTLEPTDGSSESTTGMGPATRGTETGSEESGAETMGVIPGDCSTYLQDCPDGQKCMPWATAGDGSWDALACFALEPVDPGEPGEACVVFETATSGLDDCGETSMCWDVNTRTNQGTCVPFCTGSAEEPVCGDGLTCAQRNEGVIALCLPLCDPLASDCDVGSACVPDDNGFVCVPDASGPGGAVGEPCEFINTCDPGTFCAASGVLNGCAAAACCAEFCDVEGLDDCAGPSVCVPYYEDGSAPPGYESVGYCGVEV